LSGKNGKHVMFDPDFGGKFLESSYYQYSALQRSANLDSELEYFKWLYQIEYKILEIPIPSKTINMFNICNS